MDLFAQNLRARAKELGLSHAEVARRAGLEARRFSHYVCGTREPDLATLVRIAETLETTTDALLKEGEGVGCSREEALIDRLNAAAFAMSERQLEMFVIQAEGVVAAEDRDWT